MARFGWPSKGHEKRRTREINPVFLTLFGIPFLAVGVGMAIACAMSLAQANSMRSWQETQATILEVGLESHSSSEGGDTYRVTAARRSHAT